MVCVREAGLRGGGGGGVRSLLEKWNFQAFRRLVPLPNGDNATARRRCATAHEELSMAEKVPPHGDRQSPPPL